MNESSFQEEVKRQAQPLFPDIVPNIITTEDIILEIGKKELKFINAQKVIELEREQINKLSMQIKELSEANSKLLRENNKLKEDIKGVNHKNEQYYNMIKELNKKISALEKTNIKLMNKLNIAEKYVEETDVTNNKDNKSVEVEEVIEDEDK